MENIVNTRFNRGLKLAQASGILVRFEYLQGRGGGICQVNQHAQIFVDLALNPSEQLQSLESALQLVIDEKWPVAQRDQLEGWVGSG
jgi:hypothetical protein